MEIKADVILKATKVDGIYDADPMMVKDAKKFTEITYMEVLQQGLKVMDSTAISPLQRQQSADRHLQPERARKHPEGRHWGRRSARWSRVSVCRQSSVTVLAGSQLADSSFSLTTAIRG